jgi:phage recombination protein Bet
MTAIATTEQNKDGRSVLVAMANKYGMEPRAFETTVKATLGLDKADPGQFAAFLLVANEYNLNPLTREIYAFPTKNGGIQPIVSIDGWMNLANSNPMLDGIEFSDVMDEKGCLAAITCKVYRKDRKHATEVTEYMGECRRNTDPWKQWPARMLRHKAAIQALRYAFGFAGLIDQDEFERMMTVEGKVQQVAAPMRKAEPIGISVCSMTEEEMEVSDNQTDAVSLTETTK